MNLINLENITKSYTEHPLFDHASFSLQEGEKVGILGVNGAGKSTLLKILAGKEAPDEGVVTMANHVVLRYLPQDPVLNPEASSLSCVLSGNVREENRWNIESEAKAMMTRLGITYFEEPAGRLSGGQRKRLALIGALLNPGDVLLLDEPTNHLDHAMADWLEDYLKKWRGSLILVTHDRYFLDSVASRIVEIDKGKLYSYQANYSGFLERKAERQEREAASERKRQSILRGELEWIRRGARARSTKQKAHIQRYEELRDRPAPTADTQIELNAASSRLGRTTVELAHICKAYGERTLIDDFSYIFLKGDRVGFIGPNGCGKSTLMKILAGLVMPDSGRLIVGQTVKIGYYAQEIDSRQPKAGESLPDAAGLSYMDPEKRAIDYIRDTAEYVRTADGLVSASAILEKFLFPPEKQYGRIGKLSGGEKKRLNLLRVLASAPNVLILDEASNNLDIATLRILEDYLDTYEGIVIAVSHDRYFLDRTMKRIFAFEENGRLRQYEGGYTDYALRKKAEQEPAANGQAAGGRKKPAKEEGNRDAKDKGGRSRGPQKLRFTYKEQKDYESIEQEIASLEGTVSGLEREIAAAASDFVRLNRLLAEKETAEALLTQKMERWMYLEELAAKIAGQRTDL